MARGGRVVAVAALLAGCGVHDYDLRLGAAGGLVMGGAGAGGVTGSAGAPAGGAAGSGGGGGAAGAPGLPGLVGWAAVADCGPRGTVGGDGGPRVTPTTAAELLEAAAAEGPSVLELTGEYDLGGELLDVGSDKTLVGVGSATILGAVRVSGATNVVLQDLRFDGAVADNERDAVEVTSSSCVWIDHCELVDGADGNLDIVRGSDLVTVSWTRFHYVTKTDDHRYSNLCGNEDTDTPGKLNVTFHHVWWGDGVLAQMPRVRHGKVHVYNSYYSAAGNEYCVGAGYMARLLVENCVFDGVSDPIRFQMDEDAETGEHTAEIVERGNDVSGASGAVESRGVGFEAPYAYELEETGTVRGSVMGAAGPR